MRDKEWLVVHEKLAADLAAANAKLAAVREELHYLATDGHTVNELGERVVWVADLESILKRMF